VAVIVDGETFNETVTDSGFLVQVQCMGKYTVTHDYTSLNPDQRGTIFNRAVRVVSITDCGPD